MNPMSDSQCPQTPQLHFIFQFIQNAEFFSFLANDLHSKQDQIFLAENDGQIDSLKNMYTKPKSKLHNKCVINKKCIIISVYYDTW